MVGCSGGGRERKLEEEAKSGIISLKESGKETMNKAKEVAESAKEKVTK